LRLVKFTIFFVVLTIPSVLSAQPCPPVDVNLSMSEESQQWWMVLLDFFVRMSVPLVTAVMSVLGAWMVRKVTRKWDLEKQEATARLVDGFIVSGVAFAEEQARKALKVNNTQTSGARKLQMALERVESQVATSGLPGIARDELVSLVESKLQMERSRPDGVVPSDPDGGRLK
jgi:cytochrome c biogenesis factor